MYWQTFTLRRMEQDQKEELYLLRALQKGLREVLEEVRPRKWVPTLWDYSIMDSEAPRARESWWNNRRVIR